MPRREPLGQRGKRPEPGTPAEADPQRAQLAGRDPATRRAAATAPSTASRMRRARSSSASPAGVRVTPRELRASSSAPISCSGWRIAALSGDRAMCSGSAARLKFRSSAASWSASAPDARSRRRLGGGSSETPSTACRPRFNRRPTAPTARIGSRDRSPWSATMARPSRATRAPHSSTTACAGAASPRTSRSAAACTGIRTSTTRRWRIRRPCFSWAGGFPSLLRLNRRFYEVHVPQDPLLSGLFSQMSPDHPQRMSSWLRQVFGGPPAYSERYGEYDRMISQHLDKALTPGQRARWVQLLCASADEVGLPADAEFRAAFTAYLEWGSRIALENSQPGVHPPPHMPVPRWWWVCDAYPWSRPHATQEAAAPQAPPPLPAPDQPLPFEAHIKPLFRERDRESMRSVAPPAARRGGAIGWRSPRRAGTARCAGSGMAAGPPARARPRPAGGPGSRASCARTRSTRFPCLSARSR
jgi:truncated hemoglobin YjbI